MIVPTNGKSDAAVAQPTRKGSAILRRASVKVKTISASHRATTKKIARVTARLRAVFSIPKMASGMRLLEEHPSE